MNEKLKLVSSLHALQVYNVIAGTLCTHIVSLGCLTLYSLRVPFGTHNYNFVNI